MSELKKYLLQDIVKFSSLKIECKKLSKDNYISVDNMLQNKAGISVSNNIAGGKAIFYDENDILIGNIRPYLKKIWYARNSGGASNDVLVLNINEKEFCSKYIFFLLFQDRFFDYVMKAPKGTKMPRGDKNHIINYPLKIHKNLETQQKIAAILSSFDDKIELNNRINQKLEEMAKMLYDYWFVQFDFPDEQGKPYKSSGGKMVYNQELKREIPAGWVVRSVKDLCPIKTGKKDANFATENGKYAFFTCSSKIYKCDEYEFEGKAILLAGNGDLGIKFYKGKFNAYQRTYVLIPYCETHYSLLFMAIRDKIQRLKSGSRGSIIKFITIGDIEDIKIAIPEEGGSHLFNKLNLIADKISLNLLQNQSLATTRDFLLPMLMNGQIKVK